MQPKRERLSAMGGGDGDWIRRSRRNTEEELERRRVLKGCGDAIGENDGGELLGGELPGGELDIKPWCMLPFPLPLPFPLR